MRLVSGDCMKRLYQIYCCSAATATRSTQHKDLADLTESSLQIVNFITLSQDSAKFNLKHVTFRQGFSFLKNTFKSV